MHSDKCGSTAIPCINSIWYTVFTILIVLLACGVVVFSALGTRRKPGGTFMSMPEMDCNDNGICWSVFGRAGNGTSITC